MNDKLQDVILKILKTPAVAEQLRKSLVNRDISLSVDGKNYQITRRQADDDIDNLMLIKSENWDLRKALSDLVSMCTPASDPDISKCIEAARALLNKDG